MATHVDTFISATARDLAKYRNALMEISIELGFFPVGMEHFVPTADNAMQVCYDAVQQAQLFIGIYAFRYGFAPPPTMRYRRRDGSYATGDGVTSITEWEYHWAVERNLPMALFIAEDSANWPPDVIDGGAAAERLAAFKARIKAQHVVKFFSHLNDFKLKAALALAAYRDLNTASDPADDQVTQTQTNSPEAEQIASDLVRGVRITQTQHNSPKSKQKIRFK